MVKSILITIFGSFKLTEYVCTYMYIPGVSKRVMGFYVSRTLYKKLQSIRTLCTEYVSVHITF